MNFRGLMHDFTNFKFILVALMMTGVGGPVAARVLLAKYLLYSQVAGIEGLGGFRALLRSAELVVRSRRMVVRTIALCALLLCAPLILTSISSNIAMGVSNILAHYW